MPFYCYLLYKDRTKQRKTIPVICRHRLLPLLVLSPTRNDAKVPHGIPPKCIKVYRSVLNCIVTYPNVLNCIEVY